MARYDPSILQEFADDLYAKSGWITWKYGFIGAVIAMLLIGVPLMVLDNRATVDRYKGTGNGFNVPLTETSSGPPLLGIGIVTLMGAAIGAMIGQRKGFHYRLVAQQTLCQMQIEFNTRCGE